MMKILLKAKVIPQDGTFPQQQYVTMDSRRTIITTTNKRNADYFNNNNNNNNNNNDYIPNNYVVEPIPIAGGGGIGVSNNSTNENTETRMNPNGIENSVNTSNSLGSFLQKYRSQHTNIQGSDTSARTTNIKRHKSNDHSSNAQQDIMNSNDVLLAEGTEITMEDPKTGKNQNYIVEYKYYEMTRIEASRFVQQISGSSTIVDLSSSSTNPLTPPSFPTEQAQSLALSQNDDHDHDHDYHDHHHISTNNKKHSSHTSSEDYASQRYQQNQTSSLSSPLLVAAATASLQQQQHHHHQQQAIELPEAPPPVALPDGWGWCWQNGTWTLWKGDSDDHDRDNNDSVMVMQNNMYQHQRFQQQSISPGQSIELSIKKDHVESPAIRDETLYHYHHQQQDQKEEDISPEPVMTFL